MVSLNHLKSVYTDAEANKHYVYLKNKHKGGSNNAKGNAFENFYSVYQIAKAFNDGESKEKTFFSTQTFSFVDDLVIESEDQGSIRFFQIKDIQKLDWTGGKHPLEKDFQIQYSISTGIGQNAKLFLTVSKKDLRKHLTKNLPKKLSKFTKVLHFESALSINSLIRKNTHFKNELKKMCAIPNATSDKLDALGTILLGAWDSTSKTHISIKDLLQKCYDINPNYIKGFEGHLPKAIDGLFKSIKSFSYSVENGYIVWKYLDSDSGTIQYPIGTGGFMKWENDIINLGPNIDFEKLEPYLS